MVLRVLIVEDDSAREQRLCSWLPERIRPVVANTAGAAIGILRHDPGRVYAGIVLDHDLQGRRHSDADQWLCGQDVVEAVVQYVDRTVPVLIHSVNGIGRQAMASRLRRMGFSVDIIPMNEMSADDFKGWIEGVRSAAEDNRRIRTFDILVSGQRIAQQTLQQSSESRFFDVEYPLSSSVTGGAQKVTVRFEATNGNEIGGVYGVRTIRAR